MSTKAIKLGCAILLLAFVASFAWAPKTMTALCLGLLVLGVLAEIVQIVLWMRRKRRARGPFWDAYGDKFLLIVSRRHWSAFIDNSVLPTLLADEVCIASNDKAWWHGIGFYLRASLHGRHHISLQRHGRLPLWIDLRDGEMRIHSLHEELRPLEERGRKRATSTATEVRAVLDRYRALSR